MRAFVIILALMSVAFATSSDDVSNTVEGFLTSQPLTGTHLKGGDQAAAAKTTSAQIANGGDKPVVQACACYGCTNTYTIPALNTFSLHRSYPCTGGAKATVTNVNVERTDTDSSFDLCTRETTSSDQCYTAASGSSLTCFQMSSAVYIRGQNDDIYVSISCNNIFSSCPIRYTVSLGCESVATYSWYTGTWGTCSASCGGGTQTRTVQCRDSNGYTVSDSYCTTSKPATSQTCNTQPCSTYTWSTGTWGTCSATCGGGTQTRTVTCKDNYGYTVSDSFCTSTKPATSQSCNTQTCPYTWYPTDWTTCTRACGGGTQSRNVTCKNTQGVPVSESLCTQTKPSTSQSCNTEPCASNYQVTGRMWANTATCTAGETACECTCCLGNYCTATLAGTSTVSSCDQCTTDKCASTFPTKCPAGTSPGISNNFCSSAYSFAPGALPETCYSSSDLSYDVSCTSFGYTFNAYKGTTCDAAQKFTTVSAGNGVCSEVDSTTSVALTCKVSAASGLHVAWISVLAIMIFGALLALF